MDKRTPFRASLIAAALASVAGVAGAAVTDNVGAPVKNNTGECVGNTWDNNCVGAANDTSPSPPAPAAERRAPTPRGEIAALTPESPQANTPVSGYVTDNMGVIARSNTGDCLTSNASGVAYASPACGAVVAIMPEPVAPRPTQAAPQPREIPLKRITLDTDTTFNFDSAQLSNEGKDQLNNVVEAAKNEGVARLRIHVTGYADRIGPSEYNKNLSEQRADAVRQYFVDEGVPAEVITAEGRGEANPVVQCEGMKGVSLIECLRPNRRSEVEFAALERAEPSASEQAPAGESPRPWAPGTDTGTPR
jgi:OOP family OmpA-OmpF porin